MRDQTETTAVTFKFRTIQSAYGLLLLFRHSYSISKMFPVFCAHVPARDIFQDTRPGNRDIADYYQDKRESADLSQNGCRCQSCGKLAPVSYGFLKRFLERGNGPYPWIIRLHIRGEFQNSLLGGGIIRKRAVEQDKPLLAVSQAPVKYQCFIHV